MSLVHPAGQIWPLQRQKPARTFVSPGLNPSWLGFSQQDDADAVTYQLRIPGYRRRDLAIELRDRVMIVRGDRTDGWFKQRSKQTLIHSFTLPEALDERDVRATFAGGVLRLTIGKKPHARRRQIPVRALDATDLPGHEHRADAKPWGRLVGWFQDVARHTGVPSTFDGAGRRGS